MDTRLENGDHLNVGRTRKKCVQHNSHYVHEWRKYRGLSQEKLAELINKSTATISHLETGQQGYTQKTLEDLARALKTDPASVLGRDPTDPFNIWALAEKIARASPQARRAAIAVIDSFDQSQEDT